jgi:hypothetical protein
MFVFSELSQFVSERRYAGVAIDRQLQCEVCERQAQIDASFSQEEIEL